MYMSSVDIRRFTRKAPPKHPYEAVASHILPGWNISLVFAGRTRAKSLNMRLRKKTYTPNVLSYAVGKRSGEIVICPDVANVQAKNYDLSVSHFILFLFIHGLLHLKGHAHGSTMDIQERALLARFIR